MHALHAYIATYIGTHIKNVVHVRPAKFQKRIVINYTQRALAQFVRMRTRTPTINAEGLVIYRVIEACLLS